MKKQVSGYLMAILFMLFGTVPVIAQYQFQAIKANGKQPALSPAGGVYYSLPKTIFKIKVVMEKVTEIPGPFAAYAPKYLGTGNYIRAKKTWYRLLSVNVEPVTLSDPAALFYLKFPQNRSSKEIRTFGLQLNRQGLLTGFGLVPEKEQSPPPPLLQAPSKSTVYLFSDQQQGFRMEAEFSQAQKTDTILRKITIDTVTIKRFLYKTYWVNMTEEERAKDAAMQIKNIREGRLNLLTGYHEVDFGAGLRYMDDGLKELEKQYLDLFLGRSYRQLEIRHFVFDPNKSSLSKALFGFKDKSGHEQMLRVSAKVVNAQSGVVEKKTAEPDALFYRIPVQANVSVGDQQKTFFSDIYTIPQLGVITTAPIRKNTFLKINPETGALMDLEKR